MGSILARPLVNLKLLDDRRDIIARHLLRDRNKVPDSEIFSEGFFKEGEVVGLLSVPSGTGMSALRKEGSKIVRTLYVNRIGYNISPSIWDYLHATETKPFDAEVSTFYRAPGWLVSFLKAPDTWYVTVNPGDLRVGLAMIRDRNWDPSPAIVRIEVESVGGGFQVRGPYQTEEEAIAELAPILDPATFTVVSIKDEVERKPDPRCLLLYEEPPQPGQATFRFF